MLKVFFGLGPGIAVGFLTLGAGLAVGLGADDVVDILSSCCLDMFL